MPFREFVSNWLSCKERLPPPEARVEIKLSETWEGSERNTQHILYDGPDFLVRITRNFGVRWDVTQEHLASFRRSRAQLDRVLTEAAVVELLPTGGLDYAHLVAFKKLVGQAMVCGLSGQYENGLRISGIARQYLYDRRQELSRSWYLSSSIMFSVPFALVAIACWVGRNCLQHYLGERMFWLVMAGCAGALGALISVMSRTGKLAFDSSSGRCLHRWEALSRISVGALSAAIVNLAIQSKFFIPSFPESTNGHALMMIAAIAAGASERLAPSIISQFESKTPTQSHELLDAEQAVSQQTIPEDGAASTSSRRRSRRSRRAA